MNDEQVDHVLGILATSASKVLVKALADRGRWRKGPTFMVSAADEVELREYLLNWAKARRQDV